MNNPLQYFYMNAAELMDFAFSLYKKSFLHQFVMAIIGSILGMVLSGLFLVLLVFVGISTLIPAFVNSNLNMALPDLTSQSMDSTVLILTVVITVLLIILFSLALPLILLGNFFITKQAFYNEQPDIGSAFSLAVRSVPRFITMMLAKLIVVAPIIVVGALLLNAVFSSNASSSVKMIATIILVLVFVFVMMIIDTFFCLAVPASLFEKKYFFSALFRSVALVKHNFWKIFGINLVWQLVITIAYYSTVGVIDLLFEASAIAGSAVSIELTKLLISVTVFRYIIMACASLVLMPLDGCILNCLIYFNQRIKLEGLDIEIGVEALRRDLEIHGELS